MVYNEILSIIQVVYQRCHFSARELICTIQCIIFPIKPVDAVLGTKKIFQTVGLLSAFLFTLLRTKFTHALEIHTELTQVTHFDALLHYMLKSNCKFLHFRLNSWHYRTHVMGNLCSYLKYCQRKRMSKEFMRLQHNSTILAIHIHTGQRMQFSINPVDTILYKI